MAGENLLVGTHAFAHDEFRGRHDKTFRKDSDFLCYKCWYKWDLIDSEDIDEMKCPECGAMAKRRRRVG